MNNLARATLTSMEVAQMVGKEHNKLLRDIRGYVEQFSLSKIGQSDFFAESTYRTERGKEYPCYTVTKKGCEFIAHKLTGQKGTEFTARYINRFHEMEDGIQSQLPADPMKLLKLHYEALEQVNKKVDRIEGQIKSRIEELDQKLEKAVTSLPLLGVEETAVTSVVRKRVLEILGGELSRAYNDSSLRGRVYSDLYRELKTEFGVSTYKAIKRKHTGIAEAVIQDYMPPFELAEAVKATNAQERR